MMKSTKIRIKKIHPEARIPLYVSSGCSGADVFSVVNKDIPAKTFCLVNTGIAMEMPNGVEAQIRPRSGIALKYGITVLNAPGTIDSDYRGEIKIMLVNHSDRLFKVRKGMRIAQMIFSSVERVNFVVTDELKETDRGMGGFGHSGTGRNGKKNGGMGETQDG